MGSTNIEATFLQTNQPIHSMQTAPIPRDSATQYHWQNTRKSGCLSLIYMAKDMKNRS